MKTTFTFLLALLLAGCADHAKTVKLSAAQPAYTPIKHFRLIAQHNDLTIDEGVIHRRFSYNGTIPSPLIVVNEGDNVEITFKNADSVTHGLSMLAANTQTTLKVANLKAGENKNCHLKPIFPVFTCTTVRPAGTTL